MANGRDTGGGIYAILTVVVVLLIVIILFMTGTFGGRQADSDLDIEIQTPDAPQAPQPGN